MRALTLIAAATVALLTACGGGGGGSSEPAPAAASSTPAGGAPVVTPPAVATPIPPATPPQPCAPQLVYLQLFGDSIAARLAATGALQADLIARYGSGAIVFQSRAVEGANTDQLRNGTDGRNKPWPGSVDADVVIVEGGITERAPWAPAFSVDAFRANFDGFATAPAKVVFMTPSSQRSWAAGSPLPQVIRDVAAAHAIPVADADAYVRTVPGWESMVPDGVHPNDALYHLIASDVLMPALEPLIDPLRCHA